MAKGGAITIALSVDDSGVARPLARTSADLDRAGRRFDDLARRAATAFSGIKAPDLSGMSSGSGGVSASADKLGGQLKGSLAGALAPLNGTAARIEAQFDRMGGAIVTALRRIDEHMKFDAGQAAMKKTQEAIKERFESASKKAVEDLNRVDRAIQRWGPSANRAISAVSGIGKIKALMRNRGDIAGKGMGQLGIGGAVGRAVGGVAGVAGNVTGIAPAAKLATRSLGGLAAQLGAVASVGALLFKAGEWFVGGIQGASDLKETLSKVDQVFGTSSKAVRDQADSLAKAYGLPKGAMLDAAASIGLVGKASGQSEAEAAGMSNNLAKLAADAASFYNVPLEEALTKIKSGLVGEAEPLRAFGVLLSEDAVAMEAVRLGLTKTGKDLDESTKVTARASLITSGLADANGDLERTQGSTANQLRKFTGTMDNLATTVGGVFLPALDSALVLLNEFGTFLAKTFEENRETIKGWVEGIQAGFAVVGVVFRNLPDVFEITRLKLVEGLANIGAHLDAFGQNAGTIAGYIGRNWYQLIVDGLNATITAFTNFTTNFSALGSALIDFLLDPTGGFNFEWKPLLDGFESTAEKLPELIKPHLVSMEKEIAAAADRIAANESKRAEGQAAKASDAAAKKGPGAKVNKAAIKLGEDQAKEAKKVFEDTRTPFEAFRIEVEKLDKLLAAGAIDADTFRRGKAIAGEEARDKLGDRKKVGALAFDSAEARSAILDARNKSRGIEEPARTTADATVKTAERVLDLTRVVQAAVQAKASEPPGFIF